MTVEQSDEFRRQYMIKLIKERISWGEAWKNHPINKNDAKAQEAADEYKES